MKSTEDVVELRCPFPTAINIHAAAANQHMLAWAMEFGLIARQTLESPDLHKINYGWLGARVHPTASLEALQIATEWQCWLFCGDDQNDEQDIGYQPGILAQAHNRYLDILDGKNPAREDSAATHALAELCARLRRRASPECLRRFRQRVKDYFLAIRWEAQNRAMSIVPAPSLYCKMRLDTSAVYTCFELIDITEDIDLPKAVRDHSTIQALGRLANNITSWCNDIVSLPKELQHGDVHNLVIVLQHHHQMSLTQALGLAAAMHNAEVGAYLALQSGLPSFGAAVDEQLRRHVSGLRAWMRGNMDWGLTTKRYAAPALEPAPAFADAVHEVPVRLAGY